MSGAVRYNAEYFGFIVAFPDGEIVLAAPTAMSVLHEQTTREDLAPHLLTSLEVVEGFHLATPPLVWLELTRRCDLTCPHCYINGGTARPHEMPAERWYALLDEMAKMGVWAVAFTGGEPSLHPHFVELVTYARKKGLLVGIATHGLFLTDEVLDSLPREGVIISVSIDDLHQGRGSHNSPAERGKEAILRAKSHGFLTNVMTNTHRENIDGLADLMQWAELNGVSVRSVPFSPIGRGKLRKDLENGPEDVERAARFWIRECEWEHQYHQAAGLCVGVIFNYGLSLAYMTRRCSSGRFLCYVASDGTVFPCTMCAAENIFSAGNVYNRSFAEVWRGNWDIRAFNWTNFTSTCANCVINDPKYYCASRCPAMSHARHGTFTNCGASEFEIQSTIYRTVLLENSAVGKSTNLHVSASAAE
ncbi:radical SAM protein [Hymenobacter perfusus]|uniref:Radical SAM protein n=2 Tax=Hymenobacter perfusus TaxID=1236770 RepID=A0A3R9NLZ9_9BACT|nr:radical SAM protein [Hymenobacter perfusus]